MNKIDINRAIDYWMKTARNDFTTMNGLFKIKRYSDSLFFAHIVIENLKKTKKATGRHQDLADLENLE